LYPKKCCGSSYQRWWQVQLGVSIVVQSVVITITPGSFQKFTIFIIGELTFMTSHILKKYSLFLLVKKNVDICIAVKHGLKLKVSRGLHETQRKVSRAALKKWKNYVKIVSKKADMLKNRYNRLIFLWNLYFSWCSRAACLRPPL